MNIVIVSFMKFHVKNQRKRTESFLARLSRIVIVVVNFSHVHLLPNHWANFN